MNERIELFSVSEHYGLAGDFHVSPSSCGNHEHYEQYIRMIAAADRKLGLGTTHVLLTEHEGKKQLVGFITLRASSLVENCDGKMLGKPAVEIAELAVDERYAGKKFGRLLVNFAISITDNLNKTAVGARCLVVCSDPQSSGFYEKCRFRPLGNYGVVPHENWNVSCIPMFMQLPNIL